MQVCNSLYVLLQLLHTLSLMFLDETDLEDVLPEGPLDELMNNLPNWEDIANEHTGGLFYLKPCSCNIHLLLIKWYLQNVFLEKSTQSFVILELFYSHRFCQFYSAVWLSPVQVLISAVIQLFYLFFFCSPYW